MPERVVGGSAVGLAALAAVAAVGTARTGNLVDGYHLAFLITGLLAAASAATTAIQHRQTRFRAKT